MEMYIPLTALVIGFFLGSIFSKNKKYQKEEIENAFKAISEDILEIRSKKLKDESSINKTSCLNFLYAVMS